MPKLVDILAAFDDKDFDIDKFCNHIELDMKAEEDYKLFQSKSAAEKERLIYFTISALIDRIPLTTEK